METLRYDKWVEEALRDVIRRALQQAATLGLPGDHHFFITFQTGDEGVEMPQSLRAEHANEMTIVLQHQFEDLVVEKSGFSITLSFSGRPTRLVIPFAAVTSFADPSVNFGLQLKMIPVEEIDGEEGENTAEQDVEIIPAIAQVESGDEIVNVDVPSDGDDEPEKMGEVIALDAFRKK
ncbi:MAG TPA: hypothetical protein ENI69_07760 [Rhodospirillales bacterium]|nr:hypothetical protein [Rhodospirillales bacterium]